MEGAEDDEAFKTALGLRLADLRKSLEWEHDRAAQRREALLREEVARLRDELKALRAAKAAGGGSASLTDKEVAGDVLVTCWRGSVCSGAAGEPLAARAADVESEVRGAIVEAEAPQAPPPSFQVCVDHQAPEPESPKTNSVMPDPADLGIPQAEVARDPEFPTRVQTMGSIYSTMTARAKSNKDLLVEQIIASTQLIQKRGFDQILSQRQAMMNDNQRIERYLNPIMCLIVMVNAIVIGIATDHSPNWIGWVWIDVVFVVLYLIEIGIKLWLLGVKGFFRGEASGWNIFDLVIIAFALVDLALSFIFHGDPAGSTSRSSLVVVRLMRLTRLGRIMRLFQFEVFKELLMMLNGLIAALRTLVWAFVLLFFPIYILGLLLTSMVGHSKDASPLVIESFGNLGASMFLVFRCTTGDCALSDGTPVITLLTKDFGWLYGVVYVAVIMLVSFGIFNLIMATFVDNALSTARHNEILRMRNRLSDQDRQTRKTSALVYILWECHNEKLPEGRKQSINDSDAVISTKISKDVFDEAISRPDAQQLLEDLDVPEDDRSGLFDVLDADGGGTLQLDELIGGIIRLRGDPRRSDVVHVGLVVRSLQEQLTQLSLAVQTDFQAVHQEVSSLKDNIKVARV